MSGYVLGLRGFQPLHPIINISFSQGKGNGSSFPLLTNSNYVFSNSISKQLVLSLWSSTTITTTSSSCTPKLKTQTTKSQAGSSSSWPQQHSQKQEEEEEEEFQLVTAIRSQFNDILIVDSPNSRMLLLDATHNVHSILYKDQKWTGSYWDEFASLPAIVPKGPIAIFGLGGGTTARLMLDLWPSLQLEGWEIDEILIEKSREYLGISDLEKRTVAGGILNVHIGDALSHMMSLSVYSLAACADCEQSNIKTKHAFTGLRVTIDCKPENGHLKTRGVGKLDEEGKFKMSIHRKIVKDGKLNEECYAQLHSASAAPCPAHNGLESSKVVL